MIHFINILQLELTHDTLHQYTSVRIDTHDTLHQYTSVRIDTHNTLHQYTSVRIDTRYTSSIDFS